MDIIKIESWQYLSEKMINDLKEIYENSFPEDERREFENYILLESNNSFSFYYVLSENILSGFYTQWTFSSFSYIEHFVIKEDMRGKGLGSEIIKFITSKINNLLVIEVDKPGNPLSDRRIKFYLKSGFILSYFAYIQPPYDLNKTSVPMNLMTYPRPFNYFEYLNIKETLYSEVYKFNLIN